MRSRTNSALRNLMLKDYDHTTGVIPPWLTAEFMPLDWALQARQAPRHWAQSQRLLCTCVGSKGGRCRRQQSR